MSFELFKNKAQDRKETHNLLEVVRRQPDWTNGGKA
jgi:hypothetical protein